MSGVLHSFHLCGSTDNGKLIGNTSLQIERILPLDPITEIALVNRKLGESVPPGYEVACGFPNTFLQNVKGYKSDSMMDDSSFIICYKRNRLGVPMESITLVHVNDDGKVALPLDSVSITKTVDGRMAVLMLDNKKYIMCIRYLTKLNADSPKIFWIGFVTDKKNADHIIVHKGINLAYSFKQVHELYLNQKVVMIDHYPENVLIDMMPLLPLFTNPKGCIGYDFPCGLKFNSVVLTDQLGSKFYLLNLKFCELTEQIFENKPIYITKSMFLIATYPFYSNIEKILLDLYEMLGKKSKAPFERYVLNLFEVPMVPIGHIKIEHKINDNLVCFYRPEEGNLPLEKYPLSVIFDHFSKKNFITLFMMTLLEYKIIFHSKEEGCINATMESICDLLYPFSWQNMFISIVPSSIIDVIHAPTPFLIGMLTENYESLQDAPFLDEFVAVCIDDNYIGPHQTLPRLPSLLKLEEQLEPQISAFLKNNSDGSTDLQFSGKPLPPRILSARREIRKIFLNYFVELLMYYENCLTFPSINDRSSTNTDQSNATTPNTVQSNSVQFNISMFLAKVNEVYHPFYRRLFGTQMFTKFIEDKAHKRNKLSLFDIAVDLKKTRHTIAIRKHQKNASQHVLRTLSSPTINMENLEKNEFVIKFNSKLNRKYFYDLNQELILSTFSIGHREVSKENLNIRKSHESAFYGGSHDLIEGCKIFLSEIYGSWFKLYSHYLSVVDKPSQYSILMVRDILKQARKQDKLIFDIFTYNILFNICAYLKSKDFAKELMRFMKTDKVNVSPKVSGTIMDIFADLPYDRKKQGTEFGLFSKEYNLNSITTQLEAICHKCKRQYNELEVIKQWIQKNSHHSFITCNCEETVEPMISITENETNFKIQFLRPGSIDVEIDVQLDSRNIDIVTQDKKHLRDKHPILFWNLVWHFSNLELPFTDYENDIHELAFESEFQIQINGISRFLQGWPLKIESFDTIKFGKCIEFYESIRNNDIEESLQLMFSFGNSLDLDSAVLYEILARIFSEKFADEKNFARIYEQLFGIKQSNSLLTIRQVIGHLKFI